ncbi:MAG TPA: condensation domain-containing protein [Streptosporangiaceae bacterium]
MLKEQLLIEFEGQRGGPGPLTLGQALMYSTVGDKRIYNSMFGWTLRVPGGAGVGDIAAALRVLIARHESLRTTYACPAGGQPVQLVARSGRLTIDVYEAGPPVPDPAALAAELERLLRATDIDIDAELPIRAAVGVSASAVPVAVILVSHIAVDFGSLMVIGRQFTELAGDPAGRVPGPAIHQPLDQAAEERSPRGQRKNEAALAIWATRLRQMPQCLYAVPRDAAGVYAGRRACGWLWSRAGALALAHIEARTGVPRRVTVRAALCAVLAWRTGQDRLALPVRIHNRFGQRQRDYVGNLAHDGITALDVSVAGSLDELARHAAAASLRLGRSSLVSYHQIAGIATEVEHQRGTTYSREFAFNDLSFHQELQAEQAVDPGDLVAVAKAVGASRFEFTPPQGFILYLLQFVLAGVDGELSLRGLTPDAGRMPPQEIESLIRGVESLLVAAAAGDVDLRRTGEITGIQPLPHGPGWARIDSCWIELAEAQRLLDDALPGSSGRVFAVPDAGPGGGPALHAYLTAAGGIETPDQAHAACLATLAGDRSSRHPGGTRYTAMTPGRYVICAGSPADPSRLPAWRCQPVRADGTGRLPGNSSAVRPVASPA